MTDRELELMAQIIAARIREGMPETIQIVRSIDDENPSDMVIRMSQLIHENKALKFENNRLRSDNAILGGELLRLRDEVKRLSERQTF